MVDRSRRGLLAVCGSVVGAGCLGDGIDPDRRVRVINETDADVRVQVTVWNPETVVVDDTVTVTANDRITRAAQLDISRFELQTEYGVEGITAQDARDRYVFEVNPRDAVFEVTVEELDTGDHTVDAFIRMLD